MRTAHLAVILLFGTVKLENPGYHPGPDFPFRIFDSRDLFMGNPISRTFGSSVPVSCGKFRTTGFVRFCLLCLMFGLFLARNLPAQGPDGGREGRGGEGGRGGDRGEGGRGGGRGGFDPSQMVSRLDVDQNGIITANEIERMPSFVRESWQQQGLDFNRGVRVEDLQQSAQRGMEDMRRQREEGGRGRDFERSDRPDFVPPQDTGSAGNSNEGRSGRGTSTTGSGPTAKAPRTRVSPLLPETYKALDTDFDGQIALYEWRKGKRGTLSQFSQSDIDGDGFLIPKELAKTIAATPAVAAPGTAAPSATTVPVVPAAPPAPVAVSVDAAVKANRAFELLDQDKSQTVVGSEWDKSSRLKPLFVKGGVDLSKPLNKDEFTQAFVRVGADK